MAIILITPDRIPDSSHPHRIRTRTRVPGVAMALAWRGHPHPPTSSATRHSPARNFIRSAHNAAHSRT